MDNHITALNYDVAIIGGGPAGSICASYLAKQNLRVLVIEREKFPRFHIGESLLPASIPIYKEIDFFPVLKNSGKYIEKFGARFIDFSNDDEIYFGFENGLNPEIPMAYEVERCDFDLDLLNHAKNLGADILQPARVCAFTESDSDISIMVSLLPGTKLDSKKTNQTDFNNIPSGKIQINANYLIDTTGRDSFVGKKLNQRYAHKDLNNFAVFSHFVNVKRYPGKNEGDITIGLLPDRSWIWIIPFKGEKTSVGVVSSSINVPQGIDLETHLLQQIFLSPKAKAMMENAERVMEVTTIANYSQGCNHFYGKRWLLAGDSAAFLDPIFSSGVHVAGMSAKLAAETILKAYKYDKCDFAFEDLGKIYEGSFRTGIDRFRNLIRLFYSGNFVEKMKTTLLRENMRKGFTSAVAGDMWNDENFLFDKGVL